MTHLFQKQNKQAQFVKWLTRQMKMKAIYSAEFRLAYRHDESVELCVAGFNSDLYSHISAKVRPDKIFLN